MTLAQDTTSPPSPIADRGWYLAIEYGVLARERFLRRLPKLRTLGRFKELLEPGGAIWYRNLFRLEEVKAAWDLLTALRPWQDQLVCTLSGARVELKQVQDLLWCTAFVDRENACKGHPKKKERALGCEGARILLSPGDWEREEEEVRHALTFSDVDAGGVLRFDRAAIADFVRGKVKGLPCPSSPTRDPDRFAACFKDIPCRGLGWPLVAEMTPQLLRALGPKNLSKEHTFVLKEDQPELPDHIILELVQPGSDPEDSPVLRLAGSHGESLASELKLPVAVRRALAGGTLLRCMLMGHTYTRKAGGHYVLEHRVVLSTRVRLLPVDRPERFAGYAATTFPSATPQYQEWLEQVIEACP